MNSKSRKIPSDNIYSFQDEISLISCCDDIVDIMKKSPISDLNFMANNGIELATDQLEMYSKVQKRTHATFYTREPLEFAMREHLSNECVFNFDKITFFLLMKEGSFS